MREALAILIASEANMKVCGEAADIAEAVRLAAATEPDVAVIDLALKSGSGMELIKRLKQDHKNIRMIVWSMYSEELYANGPSGQGPGATSTNNRQRPGSSRPFARCLRVGCT